ncbi:hypothetical protein EB008_07090, partial [bacterium]|nr:hypothetical protein [bacterium]
IHRLSKPVEEYLYPAIEDFSLDLMIDTGPSARSVRLQLPKFTLVGATTRFGDLTGPLRSRFQLITRLELYNLEDLSQVICFTARKIGIELEVKLAKLIAERSRGTPRLAGNILRWLRDYITVRNKGIWNEQGVKEGMKKLGLDAMGLDPFDRRLLEIIYTQHKGGPVGISNLAASLGEDITTIEEVLEPHLITLGLLKRTSKGRELTPKGLEYIKICKNEEFACTNSLEVFKSKNKPVDEHFSNLRIGIPGKYTTANFLLSLAFPESKNKVEMKFSDIEAALLSGQIDLGLIIHENRFTYQNKGLIKVMDLGEYWENLTGGPIPLGGIMIKRNLPEEIKQKVNRVIQRSIEYAFENPESGIDFIRSHAQEMSAEVVKKHIELYVNKFSIDLGEVRILNL